MVTYHEVATVVEPKIVTLHAAEAELKVATREKDTALALLTVVQAKLDEMQARPFPSMFLTVREEPIKLLAELSGKPNEMIDKSLHCLPFAASHKAELLLVNRWSQICDPLDTVQ